jgi:hypothetical protein
MYLLDTPRVLGRGERGVASQSFVDRQVRSDSLGWFDYTAQPSKSVVDAAGRVSALKMRRQWSSLGRTCSRS